MKICRTLSEVAAHLKIEEWESQKAFEKWFLKSPYMRIGDIEIYFEDGGDRIEYVVVDETNDADCKEYFMKYSLNGYEWKVYTDEIVGWESCKVIDIVNVKTEITRATVITETGTQLNRICKFVNFEEELKADGCVYFFDKDID